MSLVLSKGRIYIKNPSEAPEGSKVQQGKRGGYYYESSGSDTTEQYDAEQTDNDIFIEPSKDLISFMEKQNLMTDVENPIDETEFKKTLQEAKNEYKVLEDTKIALLKKEYKGSWGFCSAVKKESKNIYIHIYSEKDKDVEQDSGMLSFLNIMEKNYPEKFSADNKQYQEYKDKVSKLTFKDFVAKTLVHEKGHLETYDLLEKLGYNRAYMSSDPNEIATAFNQYLRSPAVTDYIKSINGSKERAYALGELIAEDWRRIQGGKQSLFPNLYTGGYDLYDPQQEKERLQILKNIFEEA